MTRLQVLTLVCGLASVGIVAADPISITNTGESAGTALPVGVTDPNYTLISAPAGVPLTALTTSSNPAWVSNNSTTDWISPGTSGGTNWPVGNYDYQTTFSLAGLNPATAQLSVSWASDNNGCIFLNGVNTGDCTAFAGFGSLTAFSITSGFTSGVNTLDFIVANGGTTPSPTGVFAEISGTASTVPEPSSLPLLLGFSFAGLLGMVLRRTRTSRA
ncbi:MAG TPA: hypothetical protein VH325_19095 [Bryobacteraceae bacterium]|nr:hypothetical protein [Bryobacteraceae bacterium]